MPDGSSERPNNGATRYRLESLERRVSQLERANINVIADRVERLDKDLTRMGESWRTELARTRQELLEEIKEWSEESRKESTTLRRAFYTFVFGMLVAVLAFALAYAYG